MGPRSASLIGVRVESSHASRFHCTVTSSGLATLPLVAGQEERTGDLPLDESRDRPVVVPHALEVDAQPDEAVTWAAPGVPRTPSLPPESRAYDLPVAGLPRADAADDAVRPELEEVVGDAILGDPEAFGDFDLRDA